MSYTAIFRVRVSAIVIYPPGHDMQQPEKWSWQLCGDAGYTSDVGLADSYEAASIAAGKELEARCKTIP